jgi:hypothetical protein
LISQKIKMNNVASAANKNAATFAVIGSDHKSMLDSVVLPPILSCGRAVRDAAGTPAREPLAACCLKFGRNRTDRKTLFEYQKTHGLFGSKVQPYRRVEMSAADQYRRNASECVAITAFFTGPQQRAAILALAEAWTRLAAQAEKNEEATPLATTEAGPRP